jgi:hypothetical protein
LARIGIDDSLMTSRLTAAHREIGRKLKGLVLGKAIGSAR